MIKNETDHIYLKLIVDVAAEIENKTPCFLIAVYGYNEAKQIALAIMKGKHYMHEKIHEKMN